MLKYGPKSWKATIYALDDLNRPVLARVACQRLGVVVKVQWRKTLVIRRGHTQKYLRDWVVCPTNTRLNLVKEQHRLT